jgi:sulfoxide reductase heme-binding subunit YedZ
MARLSETASHRLLGGAGHERLAELTAPCSGTPLCMGLAAAAELLIAAGALVAKGITEDGLVLALRLTARFAFPLFWLAYTAGALTTLFGPPFERLGRLRRALGLAFAASMTVHLSLVATLCLIGAPPGPGVFLIFGTAAACMYMLALFSIPRLQQALGTPAWKILSFLAMNCVGLAFLDDFSNDLFARGVTHAFSYWPFLALTLAAPTLRFAAFLRRMKGG